MRNFGFLRLRSLALLSFSLLVATFALVPNIAQARRPSPRTVKECYYGSGVYSLGACRGGQRCVRGLNDEDYWEDDDHCTPEKGGPLPI
jgi:hypothetical protein